MSRTHNSTVRTAVRAAATVSLGLGTAGCSGTDSAATPVAVQLDFAAVAGAVALDCDTTLNLGATSRPARLQDLRFYVSEVALVTRDGQEVPVALDADGVWQSDTVALLDFEAACESSGTPETRSKVLGTVPPGDYTGLAFDLAVPFDENHLDSTTAPSPLNVTAMYWSWQAGFKFLRLDLGLDGSGAFNFHLGSVGCESDSAVRPPDGSCARPNHPRIVLSGFELGRSVVTLDIEALLAEVPLGEAEDPMMGSCHGADMQTDICTPAFARLGLDFATGNTTGATSAFALAAP
ncbi:MAG: metallo-mystery pair system four-Cys motif protein [Myxococcales bacterium]|nr:metallo-mystery pair system four-Cys motif protein [Myxococcales bacterium]